MPGSSAATGLSSGRKRVVRQGRLEVVEVGAEPSSLQGGDDLAEERLAEDAGAEAERRGERVQRCHAGDGTVEAPAHLGDGRVQPLGVGRGDEQLVRHRHDRRRGEALAGAERQRGEQADLAEAGDDHRVGDDVGIEQAVVAAVVQGVRLQRPERAAVRCRRHRGGRCRDRGGGGRGGQGQRRGEHGSPRARCH